MENPPGKQLVSMVDLPMPGRRTDDQFHGDDRVALLPLCGGPNHRAGEGDGLIRIDSQIVIADAHVDGAGG